MQRTSGSVSADTSVYVEEYDLRVPFKTKCDVAMASFVRKYRNLIPLHVLDDLFQIFRDTGLEVSFSTVDDMDVHIGDFLRTIQERRSLTSNVHNSGIPGLILGLVAECLASDRVPFEHRACFKAYIHTDFTKCENQEALLCMSIVHRSWTFHAQRALRRRISVDDLKNLSPLLSSPLIGPWVQELFFCPFDIKWYESASQKDKGEVSRLLRTVFTMCPNIRSLCLRMPFHLFSSESAVLGSVIPEIPSLRSLQSLWLCNVTRSWSEWIASPLPDLCEALTDLKLLKCLHLYDWDGWTHDNEGNRIEAKLPMALNQLSPGPELTSMTIHGTEFKNSMGIVSWLLRPRGDYHLRSLDLDIFHFDWTFDDALLPALPSIRRLRLHPNSLKDVCGSKSAAFLARCIEVRELSITVGWGSDDHVLDEPSFPPLQALTDFHIHDYVQPFRTEGGDRLLSAMLSSIPNLRKVDITINPEVLDTASDIISNLLMSQALCVDRGVEFSVREAYLPHFF